MIEYGEGWKFSVAVVPAQDGSGNAVISAQGEAGVSSSKLLACETVRACRLRCALQGGIQRHIVWLVKTKNGVDRKTDALPWFTQAFLDSRLRGNDNGGAGMTIAQGGIGKTVILVQDGTGNAVIPAQAGIQRHIVWLVKTKNGVDREQRPCLGSPRHPWIPACAGMTMAARE